MCSSPDRVTPQTIKLVFVASPLDKHVALRTKSKDWLARNQDDVCQSGATCLSLIVVSVSKHYNNPAKCVGLVPSRSDHHFIEN